MDEVGIHHDIESRADIKLLIDRFYQKILSNDILRPIFVDIAQIDLVTHLPILYDFWASMLLGDQSYQRNAMEPHLTLAHKTKLEKIHFDEWLRLFNATLDEFFIGEKTEIARTRALTIALLMQHKIAQMS